jgi:hypothetical protein
MSAALAVLALVVGADLIVIGVGAMLAARGHLAITLRRRPEPRPRTETKA